MINSVFGWSNESLFVFAIEPFSVALVIVVVLAIAFQAIQYLWPYALAIGILVLAVKALTVIASFLLEEVFPIAGKLFARANRKFSSFLNDYSRWLGKAIPFVGENPSEYVFRIYFLYAICWIFLLMRQIYPLHSVIDDSSFIVYKEVICTASVPLLLLLGCYWQWFIITQIDFGMMRNRKIELPNRMKLATLLSILLVMSVVCRELYMILESSQAGSVEMLTRNAIIAVSLSLVFLSATYLSAIFSIFNVVVAIYGYVYAPENLLWGDVMKPMSGVISNFLPPLAEELYTFFSPFYLFTVSVFDTIGPLKSR